MVGIVSRLTPQKGFDLCFEALPDLLEQRDVQLLMVGSGNGVGALRPDRLTATIRVIRLDGSRTGR